MKKFIQLLKSVLLILLGFCFLIACASASQPTPNSLPSPIIKTVQASTTPSLVAPTLQPTLTPAPTAARNVSLSTVGPWLVYFSEQEGVIAVNMDGTGRTIISPLTNVDDDDIETGASPNGEWLALRTLNRKAGQPAPVSGYDIELILIHLPSKQVYHIARLLPLEAGKRAVRAEIENKVGHDPDREAFQAVLHSRSFQWSPDGRYLAFVAMIDGQSTDLYLYDLQKKNITRLTDGPNQTLTPLWSPDGKSIAHQEVQSFSGGGKWISKAIWVVKIDGSKAKKVYSDPKITDEEIFLGWTPKGELITTTFYSLSGYHQLRLINIENGRSKDIDGFFSAIDYDPKSDTLAYSITNSIVFNSDEAGVYFASPIDAQPRKVLSCKGCYPLYWITESNQFVFGTDRDYAGLTPSGVITSFPDYGAYPIISPDGKWVALRSDSKLYINTIIGQSFREYEFPESKDVIWRPDLKGFFVVVTELSNHLKKIYYVAFPDGQPIFVDEVPYVLRGVGIVNKRP